MGWIIGAHRTGSESLDRPYGGKQVVDTMAKELLGTLQNVEKAPVFSYDENTRKLVKNLIGDFEANPAMTKEEMGSRIKEIKDVNYRLGTFWEQGMIYWSYLNNDYEPNILAVPEGLPEDSSLAIVVLGYQLAGNGSLQQECIKRLEYALELHDRYPNSYIALTGGPTAAWNDSATEAGKMGEWLLEHGVLAEQIILEEKALSTSDNAIYLTAIFEEQYPEITSLVTVTSDYHQRLVHLLFYMVSLEEKMERGVDTPVVIADYSNVVKGPTFGNITTQAQFVEILWLDEKE
ncbi:MAG: YdcF family protein [Lachnospiraceae bacterium]|nr:YdcF family protein [Lachnospiraceae bacterium]